MSDFLYKGYDFLQQRGLLLKEDDLPLDVLSSLATPLRHYQKQALARYIYWFEQDNSKNTNHTLFEMATGSGKTLVMASLVLYLYKKGYRNFIFFVSSTAIVEKTKINFLKSESSKYLFKTIELDGNRVEIKEIKNIADACDNCINIIFTTIHDLHNQLKTNKENSLIIEDLKDKKLVLLADEAHHLNASTKKNKQQELALNGWEETVEKKLFKANKDNILLEFTATANMADAKTAEKYKNKLLYKYALKEFLQDGFAKQINMLESKADNTSRMLLAVLVSMLRQHIASENKIRLKPIVLFKSLKIEDSKNNEKDFINLINNLTPQHLSNVINSFNVKSVIFNKVKDYCLATGFNNIVESIKHNFKEAYIINVNDNKSNENQQYLLNTLEENSNKVRAIFAVEKLNEGWDVLNLFDIVKLYQTKSNKSTTAEAQLIGRGARYFPFVLDAEQNTYKRKYDNDNDNPLQIIETLHYHTMDESEFINNLKQELKNQGHFITTTEEKKKITLCIKKSLQNTDFFKNGVIYINKKVSIKVEKDLLSAEDSNKKLPPADSLDFTHTISNFVTETTYNEDSKHTSQIHKDITLNDIGFNIFYKAISKNQFFEFNRLQENTWFKGNSIKDLFNFYKTAKIKFILDPKSIITKEDKLKATIQFLEHLSKKLLTPLEIGAEFNQKNRKPISEIFASKEIYVSEQNLKQNLNADDYIVFAQNRLVVDSALEEGLIKAIEGAKASLGDNVFLLRNSSHFKLYNFKDGKGFEPDFVLFVKNKKQENLHYQIFIEPKGEHLTEHDKWKESFLNDIKEKYKDTVFEYMPLHESKHNIIILGLPFYTKNDANDIIQTIKNHIE